MNIITGYRGEPHITAQEDRDINLGVVGNSLNDVYVLDVGQKLEADIVSANEIRIRDGILIMQGCAASIDYGAYDSLEISNGALGMQRIDIIAAQYEKDGDTSVESVSLVVVEGTPDAADPQPPTLSGGDLQGGDTLIQMPLYYVNIDGVSIDSVDAQYKMATNLDVCTLSDATQAKWNDIAGGANNDAIMDYNTSTTMFSGTIMGGKYPVILRTTLECPEDYFFIYDREIMYTLTPESQAFFEEGHACLSKMTTFNHMFDFVMDYAQMALGLPYGQYLVDYDQISGWNQTGIKSTYMYLILAECAIHAKQYDAAMGYLDQLREKRIDPSVYAPLKGNVSTKEDAILNLKKTSHGECIYSIYNFIQKKRWNELADFKQSWHRDLLGQPFSIEPGSKLWVFPFPMNAVVNNSNFLPHNYESLQ